MSKVIISCAVTGSVHTPTMSDHLPYRPEDILAQAVEAADAGAAILHLHARDPDDGRPSFDPEIYRRFMPQIAERTDAVLNMTTGGAVTMTLEQRLEGALALRPELASLNMGSLNFGLFPMASRYKDWKFEWEKPYLLASEAGIFRNTFEDIRHILETLGKEAGTRFELECYDIGHLYNLAYFVDAKLIEPPFFIQSAFGIMGGIGVDPQNLTVMRDTADRLFGRETYVWSVLAAGRHQLPLVTMGAIMGSNVRVGLEDSLYISRGQMAPSNASQVTKIRSILEQLSIPIATADEARTLLKLKGKDAVSF